MKKIMLFIVILIAGCTNPKIASSILRTHGYHDFKIIGYSFDGCDFEWQYEHTKFIAIDKKGNIISGVVCSGWKNKPLIHLI